MKVTLPPLPAAPLTGRGKRDTDGRIDRSQIPALRSRWPTPRPPVTARSPPEVYVMSRLGAGLAAAFGAVRRRAGRPVLRRGVVVSAVAVLAGASLAAAAASAATAAAGRAAAPPGALAAASS